MLRSGRSSKKLLWISLNCSEDSQWKSVCCESAGVGASRLSPVWICLTGYIAHAPPVVLGPLVGLILGDLHRHFDRRYVKLVWMGLARSLVPAANVIIGFHRRGPRFAITTGVKPDVAVELSLCRLPLRYQMGITFLFSVMSGVMSRCDRMAANADTNRIERVNYLALLALGIFYFLCAFPANLLPVPEHAKTAIDVLPARLIDGLGVAGGIASHRLRRAAES